MQPLEGVSPEYNRRIAAAFEQLEQATYSTFEDMSDILMARFQLRAEHVIMMLSTQMISTAGLGFSIAFRLDNTQHKQLLTELMGVARKFTPPDDPPDMLNLNPQDDDKGDH